MTDPILIDLPEALTTARLTIRPPRPGDGAMLHEAKLESLAALRQFPASLGWAMEEPSVAASEAYCRRAAADFVARRDLTMLLLLRGTEIVVGSSGLHRMDWAVPKFEVGFWGRTSFLGQGLIGEGVGAIIAFAVRALAARRVEAFCDSRNERACRMCERLGMEFEGVLRNERIDPDGTLRDTRVYARLG